MLSSEEVRQKKEIEIHRILRKVMRLPEIMIQHKFGKPRIAELQEYIENIANQKILEERHHSLKEIAKKRFSSTQQMLIKLLVLVVGSVVYSNTFRIYTASFGNLSWLTAIVGGFVASVGVDYLATEACTKFVFRQVTRQALNKLERDKSQQLNNGENNVFSRGFWDSKIKFCLGIEGEILATSHEIKILGRKISIYVLLAAVLNVIEFIGAFSLVSRLGLFEELAIYVQLTISLLPVVISWMLAYVQAEWFYRSEYARRLLRNYEKRAEEMLNESIDDVHKALVRLEAGIEALINRQSEYPTVGLAELDAKRRYLDGQIEELEERGKVKLDFLKNLHDQNKNEIAANYPEFDEDLQELTDEQIELLRQAYEEKKRQTLADNIQEIEEHKKKAVDDFINKLQEELQQLEVKRNLAIRKFEYKKAEFDSKGEQDDDQIA